jgi:hypothetical protein
LVERIGITLIDPLPAPDAFVGLGTVQALARAVSAPFFLMGLALAGRRAKAMSAETPSLY